MPDHIRSQYLLELRALIAEFAATLTAALRSPFADLNAIRDATLATLAEAINNTAHALQLAPDALAEIAAPLLA